MAAVAASLLPTVLTPTVVAPAVAAEPDPLFTKLPGFDLPAPDRADKIGADKIRVAPRDYTAFRLDLRAVDTTLAAAPSLAAVDSGAPRLTFAVPDPSGRLVRFQVRETSVMQDGLAARHPEVRTYSGRAVADPTQTIRMDLTPMGFHASVRGAGGARAWYVDPAYSRPGTTTHLSFYRSAVPQPDRPFLEPDLEADLDAAEPDLTAAAPGEEVRLRTYRLAFVTDPSYAAYFGTANVLAEKVTLMNRVNHVYNDDVAVQMELVNGTDRLNLDTAAKATGANGPCGANACYTAAQLESCGGSTLDRNEFVTGMLIGAENFDIGHIGLGVNGGGVAGLGVVGEAFKADGCTGLPTPEGDFYAIDYVAHEMGHQFAGNHTFDGTQANCSSLNRNGGTSVEPGSGSSVMAYAGICGRDDLQPHSDPYFSQRSIDEITAHITAQPNTYDEQQQVALRGWDTDGETFQLTYPGAPPVTITRGPGGNYNTIGLTQAVEQLTGEVPEISGYDGANNPNNGGFTADFSTVSSGIDVGTLGVVGAGNVSGFVGTVYNGGPGTNRGDEITPTGNTAPVVTAPADRTIPVQTPFSLTGTGTDADGDPLTYLWEQNDEGNEAAGTALLSNTKLAGPLFRVFGVAAQVTDEGTLESPSPGENQVNGNRTRTFPDMAQVLAGNTNAATGDCPAPPADPEAPVPAATVDCYSEFLPTAEYGGPVPGGELNFRVTARDGFDTGGGTAADDVRLTLSDAAGPFLVTARATAGEPATGGEPETVTWAVNGTNAAALAPNVRITVSTNGGRTWPHVVAASTPNDGTQGVTLPLVNTDEARIRIEAVNNYFFDVNDADFSIESPVSVTDVEDQTVQYSDEFADPPTATATSADVDGDQLVAQISGVDGLVVTRESTSADGVRPGTATFEISGAVTGSPGAHEALLEVQENIASGAGATTGFTVGVQPEDAGVDYTGPEQVSTQEDSATVRLSTDVAEPDDGSAGDLRTATVRFVDRDAGTLLCSTTAAADGSAACDAELDADGESTTYTIGTVVVGNYLRDAAADDVEVTVTREADTTAPDTLITSGPDEGDFVLTKRVRIGYDSTEEDSTFGCQLNNRLVDCEPDSVRVRLSTRTHLFRVAARDASGNLDQSPARRVFTAPLDDNALNRNGSWNRREQRSAYRGDYLRASSEGEVLTRKVEDATEIALVVGTGPGFGKVAVFFRGDRIGTVRMRGDEDSRVLVPVAGFGSPRDGKIRIETLNGRQVRIEGLGVATTP